MQRTEPTQTPPSPAPVIGTPGEQTVHRPPATSPAEHVADFRATRPGDIVGCR